MAKDASVAPKERVNIVYKPASGKTDENVELPLKQLVMGNFSNRENPKSIGDRTAISVTQDNFNEVLKAQEVKVDLSVPNTLSEEEDAELAISLDFNTIKDFGPEAVAAKVPELQKLLELRETLMALKGPLSNIPEFRKKIQGIIDDVTQRENLLKELGLEEK